MASEPSTSGYDTMMRCLAGGTAAAVSKTTTAPIDRVKLLLQLQNRNGVTIARYRGIRDCVRQVAAEQGYLSLWRGNTSGVVRCFPNHALNFAFRDVYRSIVLRNVDRDTQFKQFVAGSVVSGGLGGATTLIILYPFDFARTRMAVDSRKDGTRRYKGMANCLFKIQQQDGFLSWYRGLSAAMQFVIASRAAFFGLFDTVRTSWKDPRDLNIVITFILAQFCLVLSSLSCYPLDTVRRKLMMEAGKTEKIYGTTANCWKTVFKAEGVAGFYRGAIANSMKTTGGALIITLYYDFGDHLLATMTLENFLMNASTILNYVSFIILILVLSISAWLIIRWCINFEKRIRNLEKGRITGVKKCDDCLGEYENV